LPPNEINKYFAWTEPNDSNPEIMDLWFGNANGVGRCWGTFYDHAKVPDKNTILSHVFDVEYYHRKK